MTESIFFQLIVLAYLLVSLIAISITYHEQKRNGISSPLFRLIGFALCTIWPVTLVLLGSARLLQRA